MHLGYAGIIEADSVLPGPSQNWAEVAVVKQLCIVAKKTVISIFICIFALY